MRRKQRNKKRQRKKNERKLPLSQGPSSESSLHDALAMSITISFYHYNTHTHTHTHTDTNLSPGKHKNWGVSCILNLNPSWRFICRLEMHFRRHKLSVWKIYNETQWVTERITEIQKVFHATTQFQLVNRLVCATNIL